MNAEQSTIRSVAGCVSADFPALAGLRLQYADIHRLKEQGFVSEERRATTTIFKLRFRTCSGRQRVRYIGCDLEAAAAVRAELSELQAGRLLKRKLAAIDHDARRALRDAKRQLVPLVEAQGFEFHGLTLRIPRKPK